MSFDDLLCVSEWIPFHFEPVADLDVTQATGHLRTSQRILETLLALAENANSSERDTVSPGVATELARLEARCDLLLELVNRVLGHFEQVPPVGEVTLCAAGARWPTDSAQPGQTGLLTLHLPIGPQLPVTLPVTVEKIEDGQALGRFIASDSTFEDVFGRMVFRRHRKAIAESRLPK